jgi:hypothetical protein
MRIEFSVDGGLAYFPGLRKPITIDTDRLDRKDAEELKRLVEASRFFDLPATVGTPAKGAADYQRYTVSVEDGSRRHAVRIVEPIEGKDLQALIHELQKQAKNARAAERGTLPGPAAGGI